MKQVCRVLLTSAMLAAIVLTCIFLNPIEARAAGNELTCPKSLYEEPDYYGRQQLAGMPNATALLYAYDQIVAGVTEALSNISVYNGTDPISEDELLMVVDLYTRDYSHHFWLGGGYSYSYNSRTCLAVNMQYIMTGTQLQLAQAEFDRAADEILAGITEDMTEYERELYLHDALAGRITYASGTNAHNAYGALVEGNAVCEGYAEAFGYLLRRAGIQSFLAIGYGVDSSNGSLAAHEWNIVRIDGAYYHVDLTWNDQGNRLYHSYFNQTDRTIGEDHLLSDTPYALPQCDSTEAQYFTGKESYLETYDAETVGKLLKKNRMTLHAYIPGNVDAFLSWFMNRENIIPIAQSAGIYTGFSYGYSRMGREVILTITYSCDHIDTETETVELLITPATCVASGLKTVTVYCVCGKTVSTNTMVIPAMGHTEEHLPGKAPTCTEPGLTAGKRCTNCGEILLAQEVIPALGHSYDHDFDATCNTCGAVREINGVYAFENYRVVFEDTNADHKNIRAEVYVLGDKTVADPTDEKALRAIDAAYDTVWGASSVNKIMLTDAGNYVVLLKYNVGTAIVKVPLVLSVSADPKLIIEPNNNKITMIDDDETHINHRVELYYLGDKTVADITDAAALKALVGDPEIIWRETYINRITLIDGGNYVLHLCYNIGTSAKISVAQQFTVNAIPDFKINENNMFIAVDENADNNNHRATIFNMGDLNLESIDIYDEAAVKNAAVSSETIWGLNAINDVEITEAGNYIVHMYWNVGTGVKRTLAVAATLYERPVLTVTQENKLNVTYVNTEVITHARLQYFYLGDRTATDIYDTAALQEMAVTTSNTIWDKSSINKTVLTERGNYVIHFYYNEVTYDADGNKLGSVKKTVAIEKTIYDITKPVITVDDSGKVTMTVENVDAKNYRATVYYLGNQTVADITNETALKAIDADAKTAWGLTDINKTVLTESGTYVILVKYNLGTETRTVAIKVTV